MSSTQEIETLLKSKEHLCNSCVNTSECNIKNSFEDQANMTVGTNLVFWIVNCAQYIEDRGFKYLLKVKFANRENAIRSAKRLEKYGETIVERIPDG